MGFTPGIRTRVTRLGQELVETSHGLPKLKKHKPLVQAEQKGVLVATQTKSDDKSQREALRGSYSGEDRDKDAGKANSYEIIAVKKTMKVVAPSGVKIRSGQVLSIGL